MWREDEYFPSVLGAVLCTRLLWLNSLFIVCNVFLLYQKLAMSPPTKVPSV